MSKPSDNENKFSRIKRTHSSESFLIDHGNVKPNSEEYSQKALPPSMRVVVQKNITKVLRRIRSQLQEFTKFIEDMQRKTPSEHQRLAGSHQAEKLKSTEGTRPIQSVDPRPKNAPLRDAFQTVRNLLFRISNLIDQVAAEIPAEDDYRRDIHSPHFDYYYAQYVFQLSLYIIQIVEEELEQFSKVLSEVSGDDALSRLPPKVDEVISNISNLEICPERKNYFRSDRASVNLDASCEEESSSADDDSLPRVELEKRTVDALELLMFLSEKMFYYFQDKRLPEFDEMQQREFSKRALGISGLCKSCSAKVARRVRRYSSRENLFVDKYAESSQETLFPPESYQRRKGRHAHFNASTQESHFKSDSKPIDIQIGPKSRFDSESPPISDTGITMSYQKNNGIFKSSSHGEPLTSKQTEKSAVINQRKGPDDVIVGVLTVTEDPGRSERVSFSKQSDKIHFDLQRFCNLMKEQFSNLFIEENKSNITRPGTVDSNVIVNILIQCFREATKTAEETITKPSSIRFDVTALSSRDADVENNVSDTKPSKKEDPPTPEEYEKHLDEVVDQFVTDTYRLVFARLKENKEGSLPGKQPRDN